MVTSRTIGEQEAAELVGERPDSGRGTAMDFSSHNEVSSDDVTVAPARTSKTVDPRAHGVTTDESRDALLTEFGKDTLRDRYLLPGETNQDLLARVASAYADDTAHA